MSDVQLKVGWKLNTWLIADIERESEGMVKKFLKDLSKAPAPKQMAVGAGAGPLLAPPDPQRLYMRIRINTCIQTDKHTYLTT